MPKIGGILTRRAYLGIDPGASGGLAIITTRSGMVWSGRVEVVSIAMPKTERDVWDWVRSVNAEFAIIELVHSMPKQGVSSTFKFGASYGRLRMALIAAEIPFKEVTPQAWQKALGVTKRGKDEAKSAFKQRLRALAQQLFPSEKITLATSDAILLAEFCRRYQENGEAAFGARTFPADDVE